jgi:hypothetical protein
MATKDGKISSAPLLDLLKNSSDSFTNFLKQRIYEFFKKLSLFVYSYGLLM